MTSTHVSRTIASLALIIAGLIGASIWLNAPIRFPMDDAYITIANAQLVLEGGFDNYGLERPSGATSFLHLLALTVLGSALPLPVANLILACLAVIALSFGLWVLTRNLGATPLVSAGLTVAGLLSGKAWFQLMNGLETGWTMAAVTWVLVLLTGSRGHKVDFFLAALLGLLPFLRPELAVLSALSALELAPQLRGQVSHLISVSIAAIATFCCIAATAVVLTGGIVPMTAGAKEAFFAESTAPLKQRLTALQHLTYNPISPFLLGIVFLPLVRGGWPAVGFTIVVAYAAIDTLPSGLAHNNFRYLYPLLPLGLIGWLVFAQSSGSDRFANSILAFLVVFALAQFPRHGWPAWHNSLDATRDQEELVRWAHANLPNEARLLIHDAGYFAWSTDYRLVDLVGLKTPAVIALHRAYTLPTTGSARDVAVDAIARAGRVTHAIILNRPFWVDLADDLIDQGWSLTLLRPGIYELFELTPPR